MELRCSAQVLRLSVGLKCPLLADHASPESMFLLKPLEKELCRGHGAPPAPRDAVSLPSAPRRIQKYFRVFWRGRFPETNAAPLPWVGASVEGDFMVRQSQCAEGEGRN